MARALEADPINQLEENLECSVCLEALTDPRTLPCCHSFCKDCLEGVVKTCRDKAARDGRPIREFPCPDCRTMFTLEPDKHVAGMPRNHFICNMVQAIAVLDRGTRVPCSHNCSQSSVARCVTCEKFLCRECLTGHNNYRGNDGHCVLTMEELSKPENRAKIKTTLYCNEHSGMPLKVYCETCDKLVCTDCMLFKHVKPNHSCFLVKDVASNYKELLASNNKTMEDALVEGIRFLERLAQKIAGLDRDVDNTKRHIVQRKEFMAKKVVQILNQKAEMLLKEVEGIHKSERAKLDSKRSESKLYVENIKQSVQLSKKLVDQGTEEEIISSQKMMLENANNLLKKRSDYFNEKIPVTKVRYIPGTSKEPLDDDNMTAIKNNLGKIVEEVDDIVAENVAKKEHYINGKEVHVKRFEQETQPSVAPSTILVSGHTSGTTKDKVTMHFQRKGNGGGEIKQTNVLAGGKELVTVTFGDPEVAKRAATPVTVTLLENEKKLEETPPEGGTNPGLNMRPELKTTPDEMKAPGSTEEIGRTSDTNSAYTIVRPSIDQVFSIVSATVNIELMKTASAHFWTDVFSVIKKSCGLQHQPFAYGYSVMFTGSLSQVITAGKILELKWKKHCQDSLTGHVDDHNVSSQSGTNVNQAGDHFNLHQKNQRA